MPTPELDPTPVQLADAATRARSYAAGAADALDVANSFRSRDPARARDSLNEAVDGLREALSHAIAARAALGVMTNAVVGLALIAAPAAALIVRLP